MNLGATAAPVGATAVSPCGANLAAVKSGTNAAVLVSDLLRADGPAARIAEDFIAVRCSVCSRRDLEDMRFHSAGYVCNPCGVASGELR